MKPFDLLIRAATCVSCDDDSGWIQKNVSIGIIDGKITSMSLEPTPDWTAKQVMNLNDSRYVVMPSLINAHTHLPMNLFRGLADDLPFQEWLFQYILPLEARLVSPEFVKLGTELAVLEALSFGVTTFCDMYYHEDIVADVIDQRGLRGCLGQTVADFPMPDCKDDPKNNYKILDRMRERYKNHPRIRPLIAPHAPYSCSDETLYEAIEYAGKYDLNFTIHVSETRFEVDECFKKYGKSPVKRLHDIGLLKHKCIFAHGVHFDDDDIDIVSRHPVGVSYNPESNMKLGVGCCRVPDLLKKRVPVGMGTDSVASNNDLNMFKEMDCGAKLQKLTHANNTALTAKDCLRMATYLGAQALHIPNLGKIKEGYRADLIVLDMEKPWLVPQHDLLAQLVYSCNGSEVQTVICEGKVLMENREFKTSDFSKILKETQTYREKMKF